VDRRRLPGQVPPVEHRHGDGDGDDGDEPQQRNRGGGGEEVERDDKDDAHTRSLDFRNGELPKVRRENETSKRKMLFFFSLSFFLFRTFF
jgi:hypothetical protein